MRYEIRGLKAAYDGASIRTEADTAIAALRMARQWAAQGVRGIIITNPEGKSYALDRWCQRAKNVIPPTHVGCPQEQSKSEERDPPHPRWLPTRAIENEDTGVAAAKPKGAGMRTSGVGQDDSAELVREL
jgi:hypothetical protein